MNNRCPGIFICCGGGFGASESDCASLPVFLPLLSSLPLSFFPFSIRLPDLTLQTPIPFVSSEIKYTSAPRNIARIYIYIYIYISPVNHTHLLVEGKLRWKQFRYRFLQSETRRDATRKRCVYVIMQDLRNGRLLRHGRINYKLRVAISLTSC